MVNVKNMLIIRLKRKGSVKCPYYEIIVTKRQSSNHGPILEKIGFYNPNPPKKFFLSMVVV